MTVQNGVLERGIADRNRIRPEKTKRVFLSSTSSDLDKYREEAYRAIEGMDHHCVRMEDFRATAGPITDFLKKAVSSCDLFVGIVGWKYGSIPKESDLSYTELEYDWAVEARVPTLMFLAHRDLSPPASVIAKDSNWPKQEAFRTRIEARQIRATFNSPDDLAKKVVQAIHNPIPGPKNEFNCIILCGGYAKRLWPLTINLAKVLLPIAGRPCLDYVLRRVGSMSGIQRCILLVNKNLESQLQRYPGLSRESGMELFVEPDIGEDEKWGPMKALSFAMSHAPLQSHDCLIIGGDNIFQLEIKDFASFAQNQACSCIAVRRQPFQVDVSDYGVVKLGKDGRIVDFVEKSKTTVYRDVSTACYYLRSDELKLIDVYLRQRGSDNLGSFFNWLQSNGIKLVAYTFESQWFDIGDRMRMLDANRHFLQDIREGEIDDKTVIRGPVQIEQGAKIQDSIIGPNVYIGHGCKISHSQIRDSIIMKRVSITNCPQVVNCVIGENSQIEGPIAEATYGSGANVLGGLS